MWSVQGTELAKLPWRFFTIDEELLYYDGPRLILRRRLAGQLYLVWWLDSDEEIDRWVYLPVSKSRLASVRSGEIPARESLENPEDPVVYVVDTDPSGEIPDVILALPQELPPDSLPKRGVRLGILVPEIDGS